MIRTRFLVALGAIYLLLVAFILVGQFILLPRLLSGTREIAQDAVEVVEPIHHLESLIRKASLIPYTDAGQMPSPSVASLSLDDLAQELDAHFSKAIETKKIEASSKQRLKDARQEWREAKAIATDLLGSTQAGPTAERDEGWQRFEAHLGKALEMLAGAHRAAHKQIDTTLTDFQGTYQDLLALIWSAYVVGVIVVIMTASNLARSVLLPLEELTKAIRQFGQGNLAYRASVSSQDELGHLARTINSMAARLHESQASLKHQAARDSLTGLLNHGAFYRCLHAEIHPNRARNDEIALILFDLDSFKQVNDTHGHQEGDKLLKAVAKVIQQEVRSTDYVTRYGGDEFAVLLPHTTRSGATTVAERIRSLVAHNSLGLPSVRDCDVTTSVGIAVFPHDAQTGDSLVAAADQALYVAKHQGKNQLATGGNGNYSF